MMKQLINDFPNQLREALQIGSQSSITPSNNPIANILVTGLGGSGMGANIVIDLLKEQLKVPFTFNKGYHLPAFIDQNSLVIASSYSGNTEETIMAMEDAHRRGAKVVCITSGGKMAAFAAAQNLDIIMLPGGNPPRACLGYSFVQQLFILNRLGFIDDSFVAQISGAADLLEAEKAAIQTDAKQWATQLHDKLPILYAVDGYESVAIRWRQQINENGKMLCWHHVIPEMNHNELVGWRTKDNRYAPIFFKTSDAFDRNAVRIDINKNILSNYTESIFELSAKGANKIEQMLYLIYFGDWTSWYLAEARQVDATEVKVIDYLKGELNNV